MALCRVFAFKYLQGVGLELGLPQVHHLATRCLHVTSRLMKDSTDSQSGHFGGKSSDQSACKRPIRQKKIQKTGKRSTSKTSDGTSPQEKQLTPSPCQQTQPCTKKKQEEESSLKCVRELMSPRCKVVIITGGATGIGFSTACHFLRNCARHVIISGIDQEEGETAIEQLEERYGDNKVTFICGDVNNEQHFESLFEMACDAYGGADILFNNAGMADDTHWSTEVDVNIKGMITGTLLAFKYMGLDRAGNGGLVINNASVIGLDPFPYGPIYSTTQYGIVGLTRNFGELFYMRNTGVRVCGICPSATKTDMIEDMEGKFLVPAWCKEGQQALACTPLQSPSAVGQAVIYITKYGPTGSQWVVEDSTLYQVEMPCRHDICEFVKEFRCGVKS